MAVQTNIFIDQGSDYATIITVLTPTGAPLDLTGYTVKSQMRKSPTTSTAYDFAASVHDALRGLIKLEMLSSVSENIPNGRYMYDVEVTKTETGAKKRVVEGIATVTPQITRT